MRVHVTLQPGDVAALHHIADTQGCTSRTDAVRVALATTCFLTREMSEGTRVYLQRRGQPIRELVLPIRLRM